MTNHTGTKEKAPNPLVRHCISGVWELHTWKVLSKKRQAEFNQAGYYGFNQAYADINECARRNSYGPIFIGSFEQAARRVANSLEKHNAVEFESFGSKYRLQRYSKHWELGRWTDSKKGGEYRFHKAYTNNYVGSRILSLFLGDFESDNQDAFIRAFNEASQRACEALL